MTKFFGARVCPKDHPQRAGKSVGEGSFKPLRLVLQTQPRSAEEFCPAPTRRYWRFIYFAFCDTRKMMDRIAEPSDPLKDRPATALAIRMLLEGGGEGLPVLGVYKRNYAFDSSFFGLCFFSVLWSSGASH
jgi:hypothetical protein